MVRISVGKEVRFLLALVICSCFVHISNAQLAAMSVDLGNEYTKIALVKPGVPMEIVLNRESQRKTATLLSLRGQERLFGDAAANMRVRFPKDVYGCLVELLGKKFDHPLVHLFEQRFPYYKLIPDQNRGTVLFENEEGLTFSVEELVAMLLADARSVAEKFAEQPVKDAVITVPAYFNQAERRAMVDAAEIAGINLLQLMNDNTACGVNYGMFRRKEFNVTATTVLIYDMGATKTTATIFEYKLVQDKITKDINPQMTILGLGYDRTLGGLEMTFRLRDYLAKSFIEQHKNVKTDIRTNARSMSKLMKEAERVKKVLSANPDHMAQVENLHEEKDFKVKISRQDLDDLVGDIYDRVPQPAIDALKMAELSADQVDYVILMGGGTRSQKVQEKLQAAVGGKDLGKYLNTDEAIAMGAVYQAAHRSKGFKVKKFIINEINLYPIVVDFEKEKNETDEAATTPTKFIRRTLFGFRNHYPQKKVMTFSKHTHDFEFAVNYGDLSYLSPVQSSYFGELNITRVDLSGVGDAHSSHREEGTEYKGAKAHFHMDESGILSLDTTDVIFEKIVSESEKAATDSTLKKLGQRLSSFFGGSGSTEENKKGDEKGDETVEHKKEEETTKEETPKEDEKKKEETKKDEATKEAASEPGKAEKTANESTNATTSHEKPKPSFVKMPIKMEKSSMDLPKLSTDSLKESANRLKTFEKFEHEKLAREKSLNDLESFLLDTKDKLEMNDLFKTVSTKEERETIRVKLDEASAWLEDQGMETTTKDFEEKLKALKEDCKELTMKVNEAKDRPKAVEALNQMLNYSSMFLKGMKNLSADDQIFSESEIGTLEKLVQDTEKWWNEKQAEQKKLKPSEKPAITIMGVAEKVSALDREVKYLLNKAKFTKPKAKTTEAKNDTTTEESTKESTTVDGEEPKKSSRDKKGTLEQAEVATDEEIRQEEEKRKNAEEHSDDVESVDDSDKEKHLEL